ncbi:hypothetical protein SARC_00579 [Sphaeroforma arctica JP610]|uniref:Uncharacterized protein n=1 Tax=Sphaeroforma arctica JP610 TaxID=667725 RepID=A0A0L0GG78_9EUKA|nr:hypothetical protein SARC_00579 [Sphaeroforma arctica JP610]KNC87298.1 hypothetical protein SARC_00579 [Sphaeroforma arctica JP610]|eukprot:XP_014161200.1 hypothetical protein SARC_00579 [Sphaeroforma arctica JP610]
MAISFSDIIGAGLASNVIGAIWYGPLFGEIFIGAMNKEKKSTTWAEESMERKGFVKLLLMELFLGTLQAWALSHGDMSNYSSAISTGLWMTICFQIPATISSSTWEDRPVIVTVMNVAKNALVLVLQAALLCYLSSMDKAPCCAGTDTEVLEG